MLGAVARAAMIEPVSVGIVGDYDPSRSSHRATENALDHASRALAISLKVEWVSTVSLEKGAADALNKHDALWCAPGSPYKNFCGALQAIRFAREQGRPFIGTCGGFQHVVIEYARNVLGIADAEHAEYNPSAPNPFISALRCSVAGKTMMVRVDVDSKAYALYGKRHVEECYRCSFGLNPDRQTLISEGGLRVVGVDQDGEARIVELPEHPFFLATLFVPQLNSSVVKPHRLILGYLRAAREFRDKRRSGTGGAV
jgi:CTP synthase (UTP-ammonia lyase)